MAEIAADKIAFVILRAREYDHGPDGRGGVMSMYDITAIPSSWPGSSGS